MFFFLLVRICVSAACRHWYPGGWQCTSSSCMVLQIHQTRILLSKCYLYILGKALDLDVEVPDCRSVALSLVTSHSP